MTENTKAPSRALNIGIVVTALIALVGVGCWVYQLTKGLVVTDMRNLDSWGLYIINFMWFVGLSAGGLIISSIPRVFGIEGFGGISKVAVWTSICCTVCAVGLIVIDLGQPLRIWELFAYSNLTSPLMWDVIVISCYLILSIIYLVAMLRYENGKFGATGLRVISTIALVIAVLVHSVTAWIFGLQISRELWHTALLAPWFVLSALVSGLALVLAVVVVLNKTGYLETPRASILKMVKMLGAMLVIDLYFLGCDVLTSAFPGGEGAEAVAVLTTGPVAPYFWAEVVCGAAAALICFIPKARVDAGIIAASVLAVAGIFFKRVQLLLSGFQVPNLQYSAALTKYQLGDAASTTLAQSYGNVIYFPHAIEVVIVIAVISLGAFMLLMGLKLLPLQPTDKTE